MAAEPFSYSTSSETEPVCATCHFYWDAKGGEWRRYTPRPFRVESVEEDDAVLWEARWPMVSTQDWCGEHAPLPAAP